MGTAAMKRFKNFFNILTYLLILVLTLYIAVALFFPKQFKEFNNFRAYIVVSESMEPKIKVMSMILIDRVDPDDIVVDDIITFHYDLDNDDRTDTITHRVAKIEIKDGMRTFRTKPENSSLWDNWELKDKDIMGRVVVIVPYIGHLVMFMNTYAMPILIFLNIAIWYMIVHLIRRWKTIQ